MNEKEFFNLIGNETRRNILRSIAHEPKYLFQLSQELNKTQQSLQRHLNCLMDKGWIIRESVEGPFGPSRKIYRIAKNLSVRITLSQHSFDFDVFEISIGKSAKKQSFPLKRVESLSKDFSLNVLEALEKRDIDFDEKISRIDSVLDQLGSIENFLLSRKLSITGELNETISMKLEGDAHRKDRELAYTIFSKSAPITIDLIQKEVETERPELLASLKRLYEKNLLPEKGIHLMNKLELTLKANQE
ncbi:MAG: ArsR family transcriptional regulator [Candidatus Heimdallarchaeota archaeon]|nr:MAG: ArsR family transcriptional regulator [Candidatus Heimdallarchaeota archaeon]